MSSAAPPASSSRPTGPATSDAQPAGPRIVFAGTPEFAAVSLQRLLAADLPPLAVYTQPDRRAGRGRRIATSPVKDLALAHRLSVIQPQSLKDPAEQQVLAAFNADLMVVVAYGLILPAAVLALPKLGCINVHASLLPRWRGAAPIQRALLAGDTETGVDIMRMDAGLDTGDILAERRTPILPEDTGGSLHDRLARIGADLLVETIRRLRAGEVEGRPQDGCHATYARKLLKQEARLDWQQTAAALDRQVRAFTPWPVAQTALSGLTLRVWEARPLQLAHQDPAGQVLAADREGILVACGSGTLLLTRLQLPGKRPVTAAELLNARPIQPGDRFEIPGATPAPPRDS